MKEAYPECRCHLVELGYSELLDFGIQNKEDNKDIDVLMLGIETPRRVNILDELKRKGLNVLSVSRIFNYMERQRLIRRLSTWAHPRLRIYRTQSRGSGVLTRL
jgi:hypothetical protein